MYMKDAIRESIVTDTSPEEKSRRFKTSGVIQLPLLLYYEYKNHFGTQRKLYSWSHEIYNSMNQTAGSRNDNDGNSTGFGAWPKRYLTAAQYNDLSFWAGMTFLIIYGSAFGNLLTLVAIYRARWWKTGIQILIASLTVCDFFSCFFVYPNYIINIMLGEHKFPYNNMPFCRISGYIVLIVTYVTPIHCCMVAVNRMFAIAIPSQAEKVISRLAGCLMAAASWIVPIVVYAIPLTGLDGFYGHSVPFGQCAWAGWASSLAYSNAAAIITLYGPSVILVGCYCAIYAQLRALDVAFLQNNGVAVAQVDGIQGNRDGAGKGMNRSRERRKILRRWKVAKMMLATFLVFVVCYIPMTSFFYLAQDYYQPPMPTVLAWLFTVSYLAPFCNPIIYAVMNKDFADAYGSILRCLSCHNNSTGPSRGQREVLASNTRSSTDSNATGSTKSKTSRGFSDQMKFVSDA